MSQRNFRQLLEVQWSRGNFVCVGLDSELDRIPGCVHTHPVGKNHAEATITAFNCAIVDATNDLVCAFKPNLAFYAMHGEEGLRALRATIAHIHRVAPEIPVILDAKFGDIGHTNTGYARLAFDLLQADAVTVHPYLGGEALQPFLARADKGVFVLCRTSNPNAGEFQDIVSQSDDWALYKHVADAVAQDWNKNDNCGLVVGATYPYELHEARMIVDDLPILIPGIGAQGGDVEETVSAGKDSRGQGMIVNSSRGIIFASKDADFAEAARRETERLRNLINQYREVRP